MDLADCLDRCLFDCWNCTLETRSLMSARSVVYLAVRVDPQASTGSLTTFSGLFHKNVSTVVLCGLVKFCAILVHSIAQYCTNTICSINKGYIGETFCLSRKFEITIFALSVQINMVKNIKRNINTH